MSLSSFRVVVVGGGINGRCVARSIAKRVPRGQVAIVEQHGPEHAHGSSHGEERITRSSYAEAHWVAAMQRAHAEDWPGLEHDLGEQLVFRGGDAVFFGPEQGELPAYAAAAAAVGAPIDELNVAEARRRFPAFRFADCARVLHDRSAGVLAAGRAMRGLAAWLERQGVALRFHESVLSINETAAGVELVTSRGTLRAEQVVICGGPWVSRLVPGLPARATRQHVGYWALGPSVGVGRFPAWVRLDDEGTHYGLPCFEAGLMKAAFHRTGFDDAVPDDPDTFADVSASAVRAVQDRLRAWFSLRIGEPIRLERCFYTNVAGDAFICRWAHERQRTFVVSACSGHAFKLAPYTAREVADLLLA